MVSASSLDWLTFIVSLIGIALVFQIYALENFNRVAESETELMKIKECQNFIELLNSDKGPYWSDNGVLEKEYELGIDLALGQIDLVIRSLKKGILGEFKLCERYLTKRAPFTYWILRRLASDHHYPQVISYLDKLDAIAKQNRDRIAPFESTRKAVGMLRRSDRSQL